MSGFQFERPDRHTNGRCFLVQPKLKNGIVRRSPEACLDEADGLATAILLHVIGAEIISINKINPGKYIGSGHAERIGNMLDELNRPSLVIMNCALSPVQQRNLERIWNTKVIDRTGLILEIFGARAKTREGRTQVELASLSYQRSRLVRSWTHLERQRGGLGFLGGPGESQLEIDRRLIDERMGRLKRELDKIRKTRRIHRKARKREPYEIISLVGYTNAGKSTLFNRLTKSSVVAQDQLFATLDPTHRALKLPSGRQVVLTDTVGFISDLPTELVAAFRATLEEVSEADILIHVRDVSHADTEAQCEDVMGVLAGLVRPDAQPPIEVLNKIDLLDEARRITLQRNNSLLREQIPVSAMSGEGLNNLISVIEGVLDKAHACHHIKVALTDGAALAWLYRNGQVLERKDDDTYAHIAVTLNPIDYQRFSSLFPSLVNTK
ncbi:MAG: GTPase HflX [Pseudomonadota bacterium]|nr:GTPase HflX [Pseudomonadota bacterium]